MNYSDSPDEYEIKLYKRAQNFLNKPRPDAQEKSVKPASSVPGEGAHRGHVVDRNTDQRLKENKNKREEEQARQEVGQSDERAAEEYKRKVEERLEHLQTLENEARKSTSRPVEAAFVLSPKPAAPKALLPSTKPVSSPSPTKIPAPAEGAPPKSSFTYKPKQISKSLSPNVPKNIAETTPAVPKSEIPKGMGQEEADLRFHPKHGPMVQRLLGPKPPTPQKMQGVYRALNLANQLENYKQIYKQLHAALEKSETIAEKNAIQIKISQTASFIVNLGGLNKNA
jgi:hypothetical protein